MKPNQTDNPTPVSFRAATTLFGILMATFIFGFVLDRYYPPRPLLVSPGRILTLLVAYQTMKIVYPGYVVPAVRRWLSKRHERSSRSTLHS